MCAGVHSAFISGTIEHSTRIIQHLRREHRDIQSKGATKENVIFHTLALHNFKNGCFGLLDMGFSRPGQNTVRHKVRKSLLGYLHDEKALTKTPD